MSMNLLLRPHYLNSISVPRHLRQHVIDTSNIADATLVLLAADLGITDYSSIMFDYATLDRPQVLDTYDLEKYSSATRGTYFDLSELFHLDRSPSINTPSWNE